jgi:hypothetical protein
MEYKSQIGQDKYFIENINMNRRGLYFVDIGAHNGVTFSNTYCLEKYLDWNGLCVEANDSTYDALLLNRNCKCVNECVYSISGKEVELEIPLSNSLPEGNDMIVRIKNDKLENDFWNNQFQETKTLKKITKTLTEIFEVNNVPSLINYMSIDIEGADLDALKGLDFEKYSIEFLTIEHGGSEIYFNAIKDFLYSKGYSLHRINKWDAEFRNVPSVNSFDVFDTLLARKVLQPPDIFNIIERDYPFPNFYNYRCIAQNNSNGTFDDIYTKFREIFNIDPDTIEQLKEYEIQTEIKYSYLIKSNCDRVKENDILISDMYFSGETIMRILHSIGFNLNIPIFASPGGKSSGEIWPILKTQYEINLHLGDNEYSDVKMANFAGINSELTTIHKLNENEIFFINNNNMDFAFLLREFRHKNPYKITTNEYEIYNDQAVFNIPCLIMISNILNEILIKENRDTVLLLTRDGCLLKHIFSTLYPNYKCYELPSSRKIHINANQEYKDYLKTMYNHETCIIFDIFGSFKSGRELYKEVFGQYPRVHLFGYNTAKGFNSEIFDGLTYSSNDCIESFNLDIVGSILRLEKGSFVRSQLIGYNINDAMIYKETVELFCNFIKNKRLTNIGNLLNDYLTNVKRECHVSAFYDSDLIELSHNLHIWDHPSLTEIANAVKSDKGSQYGCKHNYAYYYENILSPFSNIPLSILELGLNRYNSDSIPSLKLWKNYFGNNLSFYGFDNNSEFLKYHNPNNKINITVGDITNCTKNSYNVIIDDYTHSSKDQQNSLKILWDTLESGGMYCIESLHWQPIDDKNDYISGIHLTKDLLIEWKKYIEDDHSDITNLNSTYINIDEAKNILNTVQKIEFFKSHSTIWSEEQKEYAFCAICKK